eukprot:m.491181 g.491181  ORF g.491181 m.491181 type:complete len:270 (+) comp29420_c0_seq1:122-931(+)
MDNLIATMMYSSQEFWGPGNGPRYLVFARPYVTPSILVLSGVAYLGLILFLRKFMKNRSAFEPKNLMRLYNAVQIIVCAYMTQGLVKYLLTGPSTFSLFGLVRLPNVFGVDTPFSATGEYFVFLHYLSKFLDFFDSLFMALRKKDDQLSFLHLYHHATIGPIWGLLLYLGFGSGTSAFGACINSFVHVLMYTHYLVTSFGFRNPFKRALTSFQIFQFYMCIAHAVVVPLVQDRIPLYLATLQLAYHVSMVLLFSSFFKRAFGTKFGKHM